MANENPNERIHFFYGRDYDPKKHAQSPSEVHYNLLTSALTTQRIDSGNIGADQIVVRPKGSLRRCPEACPCGFDPDAKDVDLEQVLVDGLARSTSISQSFQHLLAAEANELASANALLNEQMGNTPSEDDILFI